jgi:uncharacterized protein (DUF1778 family)
MSAIPTNSSKAKHIDLRMSQEQKELLERAAELRGMRLSTYLLSRCLAAAQADLEAHQKLVLSDRDRDLFLQLLANPPQPEQALLEGMRKFQAEYETSEVDY